MTLDSPRFRTTALADSHVSPLLSLLTADTLTTPTASSLREAVQTSWWLLLLIREIPDRSFVRRLALLTKVLRYPSVPTVKCSACILTSCKCSQSIILLGRSLCDCLLHFKFVTIFKKNTEDASTLHAHFLRST
jgi:hypothetical protein